MFFGCEALDFIAYHWAKGLIIVISPMEMRKATTMHLNF